METIQNNINEIYDPTELPTELNLSNLEYNSPSAALIDSYHPDAPRMGEIILAQIAESQAHNRNYAGFVRLPSNFL